jgi:hypothetical protein
VLDRVSEPLLHEPVDRALHLAAEPGRRTPCIERDVDARLDVEAGARSGSRHQRLEGGLDAELVERRGTEVGDEVLQTLDRELKLVERPPCRFRHRLEAT